jgi:hypothetical protein
MAVSAVVEDLDMIEERLPRGRLGRKRCAVHELIVEAAEEALTDSAAK